MLEIPLESWVLLGLGEVRVGIVCFLDDQTSGLGACPSAAFDLTKGDRRSETMFAFNTSRQITALNRAGHIG